MGGAISSVLRASEGFGSAKGAAVCSTNAFGRDGWFTGVTTSFDCNAWEGEVTGTGSVGAEDQPFAGATTSGSAWLLPDASAGDWTSGWPDEVPTTRGGFTGKTRADCGERFEEVGVLVGSREEITGGLRDPGCGVFDGVVMRVDCCDWLTRGCM